MVHSPPMRVRYDKRADVLYLSAASEKGSSARLSANGILWRYTGDGRLVGATVMDFNDRWGEARAILSEELAKRFQVPSAIVSGSLDEAFALRKVL